MRETGVDVGESILNSVKKHIGIDPSDKAFDVDVMMNINAAIFTLNQLGVITRGYTVTSEDDVYEDLFSSQPEDVVSQVKMYLVYKTRMGFDPPTSSIAVEALKEMIKETEWRLNVAVDPPSEKEENGFGR